MCLSGGAPAQQDVASRVSALLAPFAAAGDPGVVVAVADAEGIVAAQAVGVARAGGTQALAADSRMYLASVAKVFTATCVHVLAAEGELELDDALAKHVPEMAEAAPDVTLRHLLHHRSGIRDCLELGFFQRWDLLAPPPRDEVLELLAAQRGRNFAPGRMGGYSNSNYFLLALVVERVAKRPFAEFAQERVFEPLGMTRTGFGPPAADDAAAVVGHLGRPGAFQPRTVRTRLVGQGGAWGTAADLARFGAVFHDAKWAAVAAALRTGPNLSSADWLDPAIGDYRGGLMFSEVGGRVGGEVVLHHPGGTFGSQADLVIVPARGLTVAVTANRGDVRVHDLAMQVAHAAGLPRPEPDASPIPVADAAAPSPPAGKWLLRSADTGAIALLVSRGGQTRWQAAAGEWVLDGTGASTWAVQNARLDFTVSLTESADAAVWQMPGKDALRFDRVAEDRPTPADLAAVAGTFASEELGVEFELRVENGQVTLVDPGFAIPLAPFHPLARDVLVSKARLVVILDLHRDADGAVTGFALSTGRAAGLRFERF